MSESVENTAVKTSVNELLVKFPKPVTFEGKTYTEVDLSELENATGQLLARVESRVQGAAIVPELSLEYSLQLASEVTTLGIEFYYALPAKAALKVKRAVSAFLNA